MAAILTLAIVPVTAGFLPGGHGYTAQADDVTASLNDMRTGWDPNEPTLSPSVLAGGTFGQIFSTAVNGQVYAQPLIVGSTLIVATENAWVYGLNAATGAVEWSDSLGRPYAITTCNDLIPNVGVTSTPVYDPANGDVYVMAETVPTTAPSFHLFGINVTTGAISLNKRITGSPANDPNIQFYAKSQHARPGLLFMNGWVYAAFGSHCDHHPYTGFVAGVNVSTKAETLWTDESGATDDEAGIWQSGSGLMSDGPGRIFATSGDGISPPPGPGTSPPGQLAESTIRLAVQPDGSLAAQDFFSPANAPTLDAGNIDLGSGGPAGLPFGSSTYPHLLVQAGKDGRVFLLNRDNLGGREQGPGGTDAALGVYGPYGPGWGHPAAFGDTPTLTADNSVTANDYVYYIGKSDFLRILKAGDDSTDTPNLSDVANSTTTFGFTSGSPVVTSNGTDPSSAVVWDVRSAGGAGSNGRLYAFDAVPPSSCTAAVPCSVPPIWSAPIGTASKFTVPATSNGMVYVGTRDGNVIGFGIKTTSPLAGARPTSFGPAAIGSAATRNVILTATTDVTVSGVSTSGASSTPDPFTVGDVTKIVPGVGPEPVKFPVTLHKGDELATSVAFTPLSQGGVTDSLSFSTDPASGSPIDVPLYGNGTATGLYATTGSLAFQLVLDDGMKITNVPVGISVSQIIDIVNGGTWAEKLTSIRGPGGPFTLSGLPKRGTVIQPGQSVPVQVTFAPSQAIAFTSSLTVTTSDGTGVTVALAGTGLRPIAKFALSPMIVKFGNVRIGHTVTAWIHISNIGNQPSIVVKSSAPTAPFGIAYQIRSGLPVNGGHDLRIPVTFAPLKTGNFNGVYRFTWTDGMGAHTLRLPISGTGTA